MRRRAACLVPAGLAVGTVAAMGWVPGAAGTPFPALGLWAAAWGAYALACFRFPDSGLSRTTVWVLAVGGRLALLPLAPHFSDDIYRYLWDGHVGAAGVNPYLHAPADPALEPLATEWHGLVNHPEVHTIYPPGAQLVFHFLALLSPSVILFKGVWVAADLAVAWIVDRLTARPDGRPSTALPLYLWCPLVLVEVAWSGHLEPLGILPMMAAVLALHQLRGGDDAGLSPRKVGAGALLGLGAGVKLAPLVALPALARRLPGAAAATLLILLLLYLPYADAGPALFAGLGTYAEHWRFNAGLFHLLEALTGGGTPARLLAGLAVASVVAVAVVKRWTLARTLFWGLGTALLLSPTIHPWYVLWMLPLALLYRSRAWILFTGTVFLAYAGLDTFRATGEWPHPPLLALLVHGPFLLLLALEALWSEGRRGRAQIAGGEE